MDSLIDRKAAGLLTTREAATYIRSTENSLRSSRSTGHGPAFHKIGSAVFYKRSELDGYLANLHPCIEKRRNNKFAKLDKKKGALNMD